MFGTEVWYSKTYCVKKGQNRKCLKNGNGKQTANKIKVDKRGCSRLFSPDVN